MKLNDLLEGTGLKADLENNIEISGLEYDSRKVKKGDLFFAIKGDMSDGNNYIDQVISKGVKAIISDTHRSIKGAVFIKSEDVRKAMAIVSSNFYGKPSERIILIGVTGTNGKTTTTYLIKHILENSGYKTGLIGTIDYSSGSEVVRSNLTTPESVDINRMLSSMIDSGMKYCAMEVSSIALVKDRVYGLNFKVAVFSNLTSEHLDFHKDMKNYLEAKKMLFDSLSVSSTAILNYDDEYRKRIALDTKATKVYYSIDSGSFYKGYNVSSSLEGLKFTILCSDKDVRIKSSMNGRFNVYNILASFATADILGIKASKIKKSIENFEGVPGRFNKIELPNKAIAIVDYSHTSDSLKNAVLSAKDILEAENTSGKLITIFGCGGNKDKTKRPVMGNIAVTYSDIAIITSDNPRYEDPFEIIDEVIGGVGDHKNYEVIENREAAISRGIELSKKGDIILICGKGHETYQEVKGVRTEFDDKKIVLKHKELAA